MTTPEGQASNAKTTDSASGSSSIIGRVIGDFKIRREIGRGGMGTVYEAWQESLNRVVALKVLAGSLGLTEVAIARFQREARAAAKLHHPNIVPIYALGDDKGLYYYAMEYVQGQGLNDTIAELRLSRSGARRALSETEPVGGKRSTDHGATSRVSRDAAATTLVVDRGLSDTTMGEFDRIAEHIATVAGALDYAHKAGVIHRDIKPHNFILSHDGRLQITDFGLARVLEQPGVTVTGEFIGSPLYMSPESIAGRQELIDHRTDIYSLGATLYEWLTCRPPFPGETRDQVITRILNTEPTPPRALDERIPVDLETICLKAIEKDPSRRYASSAQMADDLRRYLDRAAIHARRDSAVTRTRKFLTKHRWPVAVVCAVVVATALAVNSFVSTREARREVAARESEVASFAQQLQEKTEQVETLEQQSESLTRALQRAVLGDPAVAELGSDVFTDLGKSFTEQLGRSLSALQASGDDRSDAPRSFAAMLTPTLSEHILIRRLGKEMLGRLRETAAQLATDAQFGDLLAQFAGLGDYLYALQQDDPAAALLHVNQALQKKRDYFDALQLRTLLHITLFRFEAALADAGALVRSGTQSPVGYLLRGVATLFAGDARSSVEDFDTAIVLERTNPVAYVARAAAHIRRRNYGSAMDDCDEALHLSPGYVLALFQRAEARRKLDDLSGAIDDLSAILDRESDNFDAFVLRGEAYELLEEYDLAGADYAGALELKTTSSPEFFGLLLKKANVEAKRKEKASPPDAGVGGHARPPTEVGSASQPATNAPTATLPGLIESTRP